MSDSDTIQLDTRGLDKIIKALKAKLPVARIGVLAEKDQRTQNDQGKGAKSNATVGAAHEYGTATLPIRSFLRVPLTDNLEKYLEKANGFDKETFKKIVDESSLVSWVKKMAVIAESVVADAFDTGGFGKWKPSDMTHKKNQQTLVETQQLRNSITSDVKE